jgi:hypothetical protein
MGLIAVGSPHQHHCMLTRAKMAISELICTAYGRQKHQSPFITNSNKLQPVSPTAVHMTAQNRPDAASDTSEMRVPLSFSACHNSDTVLETWDLQRTAAVRTQIKHVNPRIACMVEPVNFHMAASRLLLRQDTIERSRIETGITVATMSRASIA